MTLETKIAITSAQEYNSPEITDFKEHLLISTDIAYQFGKITDSEVKETLIHILTTTDANEH